MPKRDAAGARDKGTTIGDLPRDIQTHIAVCVADLSGAWSAAAVCRELVPLLQSCKMLREATRQVAGNVEVLCTPGNAQDHAEKEAAALDWVASMPGLRPSNIFLLTEPMVQRWRRLATEEHWRERLQGSMLCLASDATDLLPTGVRWRQLTLLGPDDLGQEEPPAQIIDLNALPLVGSGGGVYVRTEGRCVLRLQLPPGLTERNFMQAIVAGLQQLNFSELSIECDATDDAASDLCFELARQSTGDEPMAVQRCLLSPAEFTPIDGAVASWNFFPADEDDDLAARFFVFNVRPSPAQVQRHFPGGGLDATLEAAFAASRLHPGKPQLWTWVYKEGAAVDWYQLSPNWRRLGFHQWFVLAHTAPTIKGWWFDQLPAPLDVHRRADLTLFQFMSFYTHDIGLKLQPGALQLDLSGWDPPRRTMGLDISMLSAEDAPALVLPAGLRELSLVGGALEAAAFRWLMRARLPVLERVMLCKWNNLDLRPLLDGESEAGGEAPFPGPLSLPAPLCVQDCSSLSVRLPSRQPRVRGGRPLVLECGAEPGDGVHDLILRPALPTVDVTAHMSAHERGEMLLALPPRVLLPHSTLGEWVQALTSFQPPRAARLAFTFLPPSTPPLFVAADGSASTVSELMQALEGAEVPTATYCSYDSSDAMVLQLDWQLPPAEAAA